MAAPKEDEKKHFVLVHGACHGAWCWYKLKPRLESAGHRITAIDLLASSINTKKIQDVRSMSEYSQPLLELISSIPSHEKVILVGHCLGGLSLALAMENFPHKILVCRFLDGSTEGPLTLLVVGPKFLSSKAFQLSPIEVHH
ncbi:hypothetical protein UlMin_039380 [Ulmus minor]